MNAMLHNVLQLKLAVTWVLVNLRVQCSGLPRNGLKKYKKSISCYNYPENLLSPQFHLRYFSHFDWIVFRKLRYRSAVKEIGLLYRNARRFTMQRRYETGDLKKLFEQWWMWWSMVFRTMVSGKFWYPTFYQRIENINIIMQHWMMYMISVFNGLWLG